LAWEVEIKQKDKEERTIFFDARPNFSEGAMLISIGSEEGQLIVPSDTIEQITVRMKINAERAGL
jgi:hypothetical protein